MAMASWSLYDSVVRGHHVSKDFRVAVDGEVLQCQRETSNCHDPFAVAILKDGITVGHVPQKYLRRHRVIRCDTQRVKSVKFRDLKITHKNEN